MDESPFNENYGVPRMQMALEKQGLKAGKRRIARIMRENGWIHERKRRPKGLTRATTEIQEKENLLKQDFHSDQPYQKLLTDISQIPCADGKLYISPVMDCFNGEILSLLMRDNMRKELCIDTVVAAARRFPIKGAILHSDRGSQYTSDEFENYLHSQGILHSFSRKGNPYDNACIESFHSVLKKEEVYTTTYQTFEEAKTAEYMKHYRQVIINIEVEDDLPEQKLEELVDKIKATVEENTDKKEIQLDGVRLN